MFYEEILRKFQKERIKYILVGGFAVNLHGYSRMTADLDILVEMSDKNLAKVVTVLKNAGYRVKQPVDPMGLADKKTRADWIKNKHLAAFNFYKEDELKEVDIIIDAPVTYDKARQSVVRVKAGAMVLPVISIDDLLVMKKHAGRDLDKIDIARLKELKKIRRAQ